MEILETYKHTNEGYNPYLIGDKWQVAQLNYSIEEDLESKERLDIHDLTDEAFVLMEGKAILIAATIKNDIIDYKMEVMKPSVLYNIPKNIWHNIVLKPNAKVLIIEDANTHLPLPDGDYEFYYFSDDQKKEFRIQVNQLLESIH